MLDPQTEIESLKVNIHELHARVHALEEWQEITFSPWYKKLWWWLDGWPLYRIADPSERANRPWRR